MTGRLFTSLSQNDKPGPNEGNPLGYIINPMYDYMPNAFGILLAL